MTAFILTKEHLARSVLKAIDEKRLGFHLPTEVRSTLGCRYDYGPYGHVGYNCAIGCALPEDTRTSVIERCQNGSPLDDLQRLDILHMSDEVLDFAHELQILHDEIAGDFGLIRDGEYLTEEEGIALLRQTCENALKTAPTEQEAA